MEELRRESQSRRRFAGISRSARMGPLCSLPKFTDSLTSKREVPTCKTQTQEVLFFCTPSIVNTIEKNQCSWLFPFPSHGNISHKFCLLEIAEVE